MTTFEELKRRTLELFRERPDPTDWADNIIDGSRGLQECDYEQYVQFLADPQTDCKPTHQKLTVNTEEPDLTIDNRYCVESYKNGTEVTLHYRRVSSDEDDEKEAKFQRD